MRFALVGAGEISPHNAAGIAAARGCELAAVMDVNKAAARVVAQPYDVRSTDSLDDVLNDDSVDAVVIAVPHHLHREVAVKSAEAGKHVIVEKPLATTLSDADAMIDACKRADVALSVLFSFRYEPRITRARELVMADAIGEPIATSIQFVTEKPASYYTEGYSRRVHTDWRGTWEKAGGGVLLMNLCHMLDYFRYVTGLEVGRVSSEFTSENSPVEVEDTIAVSLRYTNGAIGSVLASGVARGEKWRSDERVWGSKGSIELAPAARVYSMRRQAGLTPARWQRFGRRTKSERLSTYFTRFVQAVENGEAPDVTGEDGRVNLEAILATYEAGRTGGTVELGGGS